MLEYIGDLGGLFDGLKLLAGQLIAPITAFALQSELFSQNFPMATTRGLHNEAKIKPQSYLRNLMCGCHKNTKYRRMLQRTEKTFSKQLDIVSFVQQRKMLLLTALSTLRAKQLIMIERHSKLKLQDIASD